MDSLFVLKIFDRRRILKQDRKAVYLKFRISFAICQGRQKLLVLKFRMFDGLINAPERNIKIKTRGVS